MPRRSGPRLLAAAVTAVALALLPTACGGSSGTSSAARDGSSSGTVATRATPAAAATPDLSGVTLTLGDQANGLKTLLNAAGTLKGAPYHVKWAEFQGAAPLFQAMQSGQVDTGTAADLPTLQAISGGLKIKLVAAATSNGSGTAILTQPGSPVHSVADLRGRTVVVSSAKGSIAEYLLAKALTEAGLSYSDVHVQYLLPTAAQAAFHAGKIQTWATFGVYQDIAVQQGARVVVDGEDGRTSGVGFISASAAALGDPARRAAVADFLHRLAEAYAWSDAHRAQFATVFAQQNGVAQSVAQTVVAQGSTALQPVSAVLVGRVQGVSDLMSRIGSLPSDVQVAGTVDATLFPHPLAP